MTFGKAGVVVDAGCLMLYVGSVEYAKNAIPCGYGAIGSVSKVARIQLADSGVPSKPSSRWNIFFHGESAKPSIVDG